MVNEPREGFTVATGSHFVELASAAPCAGRMDAVAPLQVPIESRGQQPELGCWSSLRRVEASMKGYGRSQAGSIKTAAVE